LASSGKEVIQMVKLVAMALVVLVLGIGIGYGVRVRTDSGVGCQAATAYFSKLDTIFLDNKGTNRLQALMVLDGKLNNRTVADDATAPTNQLFAAFHQMQEQCN